MSESQPNRSSHLGPEDGLENRVLYVDDNEAIRTVVTRLLGGKEGFVVETAGSLVEARRCLATQQFGVIVLDKNLPDGSGLELMRELTLVSPDVRVILYTAYGSKESAIEGLREGACDYLEKPADNDLLVAKVRRASAMFAVRRERTELLRDYDLLFETIPGLVCFMTHEGVIKRINHVGASMLGYDRAGLEDRHYSSLLPDDEPEEAHFAFTERRTGERASRQQRVRLRDKTGSIRLFDISATGAYEHGGDSGDPVQRGTLGVGWDVTEKVSLERQLEEARRLEALGRVAGAIAHDFNNYLTAIVNGAEAVRDTMPGDDPRMQELDVISVACGNAASLTRKLLTISSRGVVKVQTVTLREQIQRIEDLLRRMVPENVQIDIDLADDGAVDVSSEQLDQVLINLVANSRDAMPEGGTIKIETGDVDVDPETARRFIDVKPGSYISLCVSDQGQGMSPEVRERLFEPFFSTKPMGHGTGLGMATVHGVIKQSRGFSIVESAVGKGTEIRVFFPQSENKPSVSPNKPKTAWMRGTETILLVDDEELMRRSIGRRLVALGYDVVEACDGLEAMMRVEEEPDRFDAVITDIVMPNVSGVEFASRVLENRPDLPVLFVSGYAGSVCDDDIFDRANCCFVHKPFNLTQLLRGLRGLLGPTQAG